MRALALALAALAALASLPGATLAQGDPCARLWADLPQATGVPTGGTASLAADGWCEVAEARLGGGADYAPIARIERLRWRAEGLERLVSGGKPPTAIEVTVEGMTLGATTSNPLLDWALAAQARPNGIDGHLALAWDAPSREVRLTDLSLDLPGDNAIQATATLSGVDLSSEATAQVSLGSMALTSADVTVTTHGLFEAYLLLPLATTLLDGSPDPEREVEGLKGLVAAEIARLPETIFPDPTREDLAALLAELPNPAGTLTLSLATEAGGGIGPARFAVFALVGVPRSPAELWPALEGVTIRAGWAPSSAEATPP